MMTWEEVRDVTRYFVSPDGDDSYSGTSMQRPFRTVGRAVAGLVAGDELQLMEGRISRTSGSPSAVQRADRPS
jgi:hypothetical protein